MGLSRRLSETFWRSVTKTRWRPILVASLLCAALAWWLPRYKLWEAHYHGRPSSFWAGVLIADRRAIGTKRVVPKGAAAGLADSLDRQFNHLDSGRQIPDPDLLPVLSELLNHPNRDVRRAAAGRMWRYGENGFRQVLPVFLEVLERNPDPKERQAVAWMIGTLGNEYPNAIGPAIPDLLRCCDRETDKSVRDAMALGFRMIDPKSTKWPPFVCEFPTRDAKYGMRFNSSGPQRYVSGFKPGSPAAVLEPSAPSGSGCVLELPIDAGPSLLTCVALNFASPKNLEMSVSLKVVSGRLEQGGGLLWRMQDADNYYALGVDPLHGRLRLYKVVAGQCTRLCGANGLRVDPGKWHRLSVRHFGDRIECSLDEISYLQVTDASFTKAGEVGLWTRLDARTYFDGLQVDDYGN
jgi:hypothetical protein